MKLALALLFAAVSFLFIAQFNVSYAAGCAQPNALCGTEIQVCEDYEECCSEDCKLSCGGACCLAGTYCKPGCDTKQGAGSVDCELNPVTQVCKPASTCPSSCYITTCTTSGDPGTDPPPGDPPPPPPSCWAPCTDSSQCASGLTCAGGSCYSCDCDASCGGPGDPPPPPGPHSCDGQDCPDGSHCGKDKMCAGPDSEGNYYCRGDPECNNCNSNGSCNSGENCDNCAQDCCAGYVAGYVFDDDYATACTQVTTYPVSGAQVSFTAVNAVKKNGCSISGSDNTSSNGKYKRLLCTGTYRVAVTKGNYLSTPSLYCGGLGGEVTVARSKTTDLDIGLTQVSGGWFQAQGSGNVRAEKAVDNRIPPTCTDSCTPYVITSPTKGEPGVLTYGTVADLTDSATQTNADVASAKKWLINSHYGGRQYGYLFYFNQLGWPLSPQVDFTTLTAKPTAVPKNGKAYYTTGDLTIAGADWLVSAGESISIVVNGNVTIKNKIRVAKTGFLLVLASGNITIDPLVNSEDTQPAIEGIYIADGTFATGAADTKLILAGTFVGWTDVKLERDFSLNYQPGSPGGSTQAARNNTEPVEVFVYRQDLIKSAPTWMTRPRISWEEVAP